MPAIIDAGSSDQKPDCRLSCRMGTWLAKTDKMRSGGTAMATRLMRAGFAALAIAALTASAAEAKTFRWANDGDSNSMDPYARQETFLLLFDMSFYEPLVRRDREMKLEPGLAIEWKQTDPTTWRFKLRQGVKFHDGTPFTA